MLHGDLADRLQKRLPPQRVLAASIGVLPACAAWPVNGDRVPLDAERAEHHAHRQLQAFQHRPLLDVQFEIRGGVPQFVPRLGASVRSMPVLGGVDQLDAVLVVKLRHRGTECPLAALDPNRLRPNRAPSSSAQSTRRTVTGGVPCSAALAAQHFHAGDDVQAAVEPAAVGHAVDVPADQQFLRLALERRPQVAGRVGDDVTGDRSASPSATRGPCATSVNATRCAPSASPVSGGEP